VTYIYYPQIISNNAVKSVLFATDIIFILNAIILSRTAYRTETGELEYSNEKILENFTCHEKLRYQLDLLSTIPLFQCLGLFQEGIMSNIFLLRCLRLWHPFVFYIDSTCNLFANAILTKTWFFLMILFIMFHTLASFDKLVTCDKSCTGCMRADLPRCVETANSNFFTSYTNSFYNLMLILSTAGGSYCVTKVCWSKVVYATIVIVVPNFIFSLVLGEVLALHHYAEKVVYGFKVGNVLKYLRSTRTGPGIIEKCKNRLEYMWELNRGVVRPKFLDKLPHCLRADICQEAFSLYVVRTRLFLFASDGAIRRLCSALTQICCLKEDEVVRIGMSNANLFIIKSGEVLEVARDSSIHRVLYNGECFGEIQCIVADRVEPHMYTYRCKMKTDLLIIPKECIQVELEADPELRGKAKELTAGMYKDFADIIMNPQPVKVTRNRKRNPEEERALFQKLLEQSTAADENHVRPSTHKNTSVSGRQSKASTA